MSRFSNTLLFAALAMLPAARAVAADKWVHATSPHFDLYAAQSEADAKAALQHLEEVRAFFVNATHSQDPNGQPVRIVSFQSAGDFNRYKPVDFAGAVTAYSFSGSPATIVALGLKPENYEKIFEEYCRMVLDQSAPKVPFWLRAGLAQFYSTLKPGEGSMKMGAAPTRSFHTHSGGDVRLNEVFLVDRSLYLQSRAKSANDFYADTSKNAALGTRGAAATSALNAVQTNLSVDYELPCWTLAHMLMFNPNYRAKVGEFIGRLSNGEETVATFGTVYGKSLAEVFADFLLYEKQPSMAVATLNFKYEKPAAPQVKTASKEEAEAAVTDLMKAGK